MKTQKKYTVNKQLLMLFLLLVIKISNAQQLFPPALFDSISVHATEYLLSGKSQVQTTQQPDVSPSGATAAFKALEKVNDWRIDVIKPSQNKSTDTLFVGLTPGDSLYITGAFMNDGPVLVYGDGILIFNNAQAFINGDIIVWGNTARLEIRNSTIISPQAYLYQRGMIAAGEARIHLENTILNYSGLSHNLVVTDSAKVSWTNVTKSGFTTCGMWNKGEIDINGTPQAGEFIMTHKTKASFTNANTVLIWHHITDTAQFSLTFPDGDTLSSWQLNSSLSSIQHVYYEYVVNNCTDVMWGLMPEPGSQTHISNSKLRTIGLWFKNQNGFQASGLVNSSQYANFTAPLNDRTLVLQNTFVRTWSLYIFENAQGFIDNCIVGEIGVFDNGDVEVGNSLIDGSGGYIFSEGVSKIINGFSFLNCDFQSKHNSFAFQVYGGQNWGRCIALDKSIMIVVQSNLSDIPEIYNDAMVWYVKLEGSSNLSAGTTNPIMGSAWLDKASNFYPHEFSHYAIDYKHLDSTNWIPICGPVFNEVYNNVLCAWNTTGVAQGTYLMRLRMWDNTLDSNMVEAIRLYSIQLLTPVVDVVNEKSSITVYPNPAKNTFSVSSAVGLSEVCVTDLTGRVLHSEAFPKSIYMKTFDVQAVLKNSGVYIIKLIDCEGNIHTERLVVFY